MVVLCGRNGRNYYQSKLVLVKLTPLLQIRLLWNDPTGRKINTME